MSMIYKDKHLNYFVAGVPNLNIKFFKSKRCLAREKKKSAEAYAERQRRKQAMGEIGAIIGGMLSAAEVMDKDTNDGK